MKIALSGAHRTGKTTLLEELGRLLPGFECVEEPYVQLAEEGHEFAEMPSLEDFELQLERSIACLLESDGDQIFDRCPADMLAYLVTHRDSAGFDLKRWLPRAREAMQRLDLVVFVPIESPDRIGEDLELEDEDLRRRVDVDEELREVLLEDRWGLGVEVIEVVGMVQQRAGRVVAESAGGP